MVKWFDYFPIKPGEFVVDLGACVGEATFPFARKTGKKGLVVALEPDITNFRVLHNMIIKYQFANTIAFLAGIGRKTGRTQLNIGGWNAHSTALKGKRFHGKRVVPIISWDDLMGALALPRVDIAKINVEGAEIGALEGMTKVLPDKIMLDAHYRFGVDPEYLERMLWEKGYTILERRDSDPPRLVKNLIYARRE